MNNAFKIWEEIRGIYLRYINTGLSIRDAKLEAERNLLFEEPNAVCKLPIVELLPKYEEFKSLRDACVELGLNSKFADFAQAGLFSGRQGEERKLYKHQFQAMQQAICNRKNIIATTGTGSGKTECFLLPLLYDILTEKLEEGQKQAAVRGLVLYPLNALAEDQMRRLRTALSSTDAIEWLNENAAGKRITFGRYTGITPVSGHRNTASNERLRIEKQNLNRNWESAKDQTSKSFNIDFLNDLPNMDDGVGAEHWDRWTMQDCPPDLLITNYSMLNIMLLRSHEQSIFRKTRSWLENDERNVFHIVIDELHSYRGTAGTEVAYLIRLLLLRLGLTPESKQVQFLCSSASLQESARTRKFVTGFFGFTEDRFDDKFIVIGNDSGKDNKETNNRLLEANTFQDLDSKTDQEIQHIFEQNQVLEFLRRHVPTACEAEVASKKLFGSVDEDLGIRALTGLLAALARLRDSNGNILQPQRVHYFFRNIEGLWACSNNGCSEVDEEYQYRTRPFGKLYRTPRSTCRCGSVVLESLLCRHCGELFLGGWSCSDHKECLTIEKRLSDVQGKYITIYNQISDEMDGWVKCNF